MVKKSFEYWGVYDSGVPATPRGPKKLIEQMAGMLSNPGDGQGQGRKVCIAKGEKGGLGEAQTGVCYVNGARQRVRKPRPTTAIAEASPPKPTSDGS